MKACKHLSPCTALLSGVRRSEVGVVCGKDAATPVLDRGQGAEHLPGAGRGVWVLRAVSEAWIVAKPYPH